jgi:hypothetical protein
MAAEEEATAGIDEALRSFQADQPPNTPDPTGLDEMMPMLASGQTFYTAARLSGFSEAQAFTLTRDYLKTMLRLSSEAQQ